MASAIWSTRSERFTRCKNHGGMSTGPKIAEGIERIRRAVTKHGRYAKTGAKAKREPNGDKKMHNLLAIFQSSLSVPLEVLRRAPQGTPEFTATDH
jgi:hypothetical protein